MSPAAILTWSRSDVPSTSNAPLASIAPVNVDIPVTLTLVTEAISPVTVRSSAIVTSSGSPMTTLLVPVTVSISFAVPSISKTSLLRLIVSFDPESADTVKVPPPGPAGDLSSTYS